MQQQPGTMEQQKQLDQTKTMGCGSWLSSSSWAASQRQQQEPQLLPRRSSAPPRTTSTSASLIVAAGLLLLPMAEGHEHGVSHIQDGEAISMDPIDTILWLHIFIMMFAFGILFPLGMVLGIVKSRWHVPLQTLSSLLAILGYALGHMHAGRQFLGTNVHARFASSLFFMLFAQIILGVYLKLHLEKGFHGRIRPWIRRGHGILGKAFPVVSWTQMLFGGITALGFCQGDHLGQCVAHFIMGSAFIAYGAGLTIMLLAGQLWLRRTGRSQEFFDSAVIAAWGCVNTFTEHHWGTEWVRNDWQHTAMGIIWWCAGLTGVWLSKGRDGLPRRNFIPGFVLLATGWAMSAHPQDLMISAATHRMFGYTLMAAGVTRIIEVSFVLNDKPAISNTGYDAHSFQYIPVFLLYASGFLFMGATEEQMVLLDASGMDHVAYILILYSCAFLTFLFVCLLLNVYDRSIIAKQSAPVLNGRATTSAGAEVTELERRQMRDAEEFELDGLMSDDEDEELASRKKLLSTKDVSAGSSDDGGLASPSTLGRNSDRVA